MDDINFDRMGIYDLRNYARSIGVISPTKLRRQELISSIRAIIEGIEKPEKPKDNRGRPPKHKVDDMYMLDMFVPKNLFKYDAYDSKQNMFSSNFSAKIISDLDCLKENNSSFSESKFSGYFVQKTENYGLILIKGFFTEYFKENIIILKDLIERFALREGDFVEGYCQYIKDKNVLLAKNITKINNNLPDKILNRPYYEQILAQYPSKPIKLSSKMGFVNTKLINKICPLAYGARAVINEKHDSNFVDFSAEIINNLTCEGIKTWLVSVDDPIEDIVAIKEACADVEVCKYMSSLTRKQFFQKIDILCSNLCRELEIGNDVALVLYNGQNLLDNFANFAVLEQQYSPQKAIVYAQNKLKDIFSLARATEHGSLTVLAFNIHDKIVLPATNCRMEFLEKSYLNTDITLDLYNSQTLNVQKILSNEEWERLNRFKQRVNDKNLLQELELLFENE